MLAERSTAVKSVRPAAANLHYGQAGETAVKVLHSHVLCADKGKWGALHGAVVRPDTAEIATLPALGVGFSFTG